MTDNYIQLKKSNILKLGIKDENGEPTGEFLEFDLEDAGLLLKYQDLIEQEKRNQLFLKNQLFMIRKRPDVKGKKLLSKNEEDELRAKKDFLEREKNIYNIFLGDRGVEKLLNGKEISAKRLREIDEIIEKQIYPFLEKNMNDIKDDIEKKYQNMIEMDKNVIEMTEDNGNE